MTDDRIPPNPEALPVEPKRPVSRRMARELALKAAYAIELRGCDLEEVLADPLIVQEESPPAFSVRLLTHMQRFQEQVDEVIRSKAHRWDISRIALVDKIILRIGITEMMYFPDVPHKVAINEAIELAKAYSTQNSRRFVNGLLDAVMTDINSGQSALPGGGEKVTQSPVNGIDHDS